MGGTISEWGAAAPLPPVCILAGGLGTRLGARVADTPKPLLEVADEPFIAHQLRLLARHGARDVVICVGYRGEQIEARIGSEFAGLRIAYSHDGERLAGTLGAIRLASSQLGERFMVLYGDTYLRINYSAAAEAWRRSGLPAMMAVLRNENRWERSNVLFDGNRVTRYDKRRPSAAMRWIDYGLGGLTGPTLDLLEREETELAQLYMRLAARGELFGVEARERFYEIGTPASLAETDSFLRTLKPPSRSGAR